MAGNKIKVTITNQAGKKLEVRLPTNKTVGSLISELITKPEVTAEFNFSPNNQFVLVNKQTGRTISNNDSLISAGVKDGDILHLISSRETGESEMTSVTINGNPIEISDGMTALEILKTAGFSSGHHLALEMPDGTLMHLDDNEPVKASPGDNFIPVPVATKGR